MPLTVDIFFHDREGWQETKHPRGQPKNAGQFAKQQERSQRTTVTVRKRTPQPQRRVAEPTEPVRPATALLEKHASPDVSVERVLSAQPKEVGKAIRQTEQRLAESVPTDAPVAQGGFKQPDGQYTPERQALHAKIIRSFFAPEAVKAATPAPGMSPTFTILGGRAGSGKSHFTKSGLADPDRAIVMDSDAIKAQLPGYQGWNAALYHEEASDIFEQVDRLARAAGLNVVHDSTLRSYGSAKHRVDAYKQVGYMTRGMYMFVPPHIATERAIGRFMHAPKGAPEGVTGRYVPPSYVLSSTTNEKTFDDLHDLLDDWHLYRNDSPAGPQLVARKGEGSK